MTSLHKIKIISVSTIFNEGFENELEDAVNDFLNELYKKDDRFVFVKDVSYTQVNGMMLAMIHYIEDRRTLDDF